MALHSWFSILWKTTALCESARKLGREFVIQAKGKVVERTNKNKNIATGNIEIEVAELTILNKAKTPPFTIEDQTDGGEDLRMQYRYLDLRRGEVQKKIMLRYQIGIETRKYLDSVGFIDIETPYLIKSTPEGARDFVVPT
jgi:aspartyl-tRNA synthetase